MEIRTLHPQEREALLDLLDGWPLADGWRGRDFFRRYLEDDSRYADEDVWVALDAGNLVSCLQIFPRRIHVLEHSVPAGGIGSVFTRPERRRSGLARQLLERAARDMTERGMEISLLFAGMASLYEQAGWSPWSCERILVRRGSGPPPDLDEQVAQEIEGASDVEVCAFERERDFADVSAIHAEYSLSRSGTVARDGGAWEASLRLAGNPDESFRVARRDGRVEAYVRACFLYGTFVATELARRERGARALAKLVMAELEPREEDPLIRGDMTSSQLRSSLLLPAFDDLQLTIELEQQGLQPHPVVDSTAMLRCLNMPALAGRLDISMLPHEGPAEFMSRILPQDRFVFWPSDRF
jgi:GNAT superfamily N-acetyltransferase